MWLDLFSGEYTAIETSILPGTIDIVLGILVTGIIFVVITGWPRKTRKTQMQITKTNQTFPHSTTKSNENDLTPDQESLSDWHAICHGPAQPLARQHRVAAAEQFVINILEGLQIIAVERRILRRAVERANIEADGKSFLADILKVTTPAGRDS